MFNIEINWKKTFIITFDVLIAVYLVMAISSWNKPVKADIKCTKLEINIADENENGFLNAGEVKVLLKKNNLYPLSKPVTQINPRKIEQQLVRMPFINTAQCYISQSGNVCITITQRTPIIRVKSFLGEDYYIDDNGGIMPNSQYTSDMIILTGYITKPYATRYVCILASIIMRDPLWRNQIEQINVLQDKTIELVPRVGDHIINIGRLPEAVDKNKRRECITEFANTQLRRLKYFYKYGLSQAGWNKYDYISLEFNNLIVCRKLDYKPEHQ